MYKKLTLVIACAGLLACQPSVEHQVKLAVLPYNDITHDCISQYKGLPEFDKMNLKDMATA